MSIYSHIANKATTPDVRYKRPDIVSQSVNIANMKLRLKEARKSAKLTLDHLSEMTGISKSYLSELENGIKPINSTRLASIAEALGVSPHELIVSSLLDSQLLDHLEVMQNLSPEDRQKVLDFARFQASQPPKHE